MQKSVLSFGLIAGAIITAMMVVATSMLYTNPDFKGNDLIGYTTMLIAFAFIFVGVKNYRDKYNSGLISFGKAFKVGLYITLVASTIYVAVWLIEYYFFVPDFMERFTECTMKRATESGATASQLEEQARSMARYSEWYKNPLFVILLTYSEVVPIGLIVALISALILKKKAKGLQQ
jgi:hypothetical protein